MFIGQNNQNDRNSFERCALSGPQKHITKFCISIIFSFSWELKWPQEKLKTMLVQNFGVTNKEHYGMLWYFLESIVDKWKMT